MVLGLHPEPSAKPREEWRPATPTLRTVAPWGRLWAGSFGRLADKSAPHSAALSRGEVPAAGQSSLGPMTPTCDLAAVIVHLCAETLCLTETLLQVLGSPVGHAGAASGGSPPLLG